MPLNNDQIPGDPFESVVHLDFKTPILPRIGSAAIKLLDAIPPGIANTPFGWMVGARYITPPDNPTSYLDGNET